MGSLKHPFEDKAGKVETQPALAIARDAITALHEEKPWQYPAIVFRLHDSIQKFKPSMRKLEEDNFDEIFLSDKLTGENYGQAAHRVLKKWDNSGQPTLSAIVDRAADHFDLNGPARSALMMAAVLGSYDTKHSYHNASHNRKVVLQAIRLAVATPSLTPQDTAKLLIAACIHDLGHDGKGNMDGGILKPFHLEKQSFEYALPYLRKAGMSAHDLGDVRTLILATDIQPIGTDKSPAYKLAKEPDRLPPELSRLKNNPVLAKTARILQVADVSTSLGICCEQSWKESCAFNEEMGAVGNVAKIVRDFEFFINACKPVLQSLPEAEKVYGGNPERIKQTISTFAYAQPALILEQR